MAHTFLSLDMQKIPAETKANVPTFWQGLFSNDAEYDGSGKMIKEPTRMLIDGYNDKRELVHTQTTFDAWLQWESNPKEALDLILASAIEYTSEQIKAEQQDIDSIWYVESEGLI